MSKRLHHIGIAATASAVTAALAVIPATGAQAAPAARCQAAVSPALRSENAHAARLVRKLQGKTDFVSRTKIPTPKIR